MTKKTDRKDRISVGERYRQFLERHPGYVRSLELEAEIKFRALYEVHDDEQFSCEKKNSVPLPRCNCGDCTKGHYSVEICSAYYLLHEYIPERKPTARCEARNMYLRHNPPASIAIGISHFRKVLAKGGICDDERKDLLENLFFLLESIKSYDLKDIDTTLIEATECEEEERTARDGT